MASFFKVLA